MVSAISSCALQVEPSTFNGREKSLEADADDIGSGEMIDFSKALDAGFEVHGKADIQGVR